MKTDRPSAPKISDDLLLQCIHCGMCLPTCPTYSLTLRERSSPRGRIRLIKKYAQGEIGLSGPFIEEMAFCLNCRACESACPAGVEYHHLLEFARTEIRSSAPPSSLLHRLGKALLDRLFTSPSFLKKVSRVLYFYQRSGLERLVLASGILRLLPGDLDRLARLAPRISRRASRDVLPERIPAHGEKKYTVALLTGCVQDVSFAEVNRHAAEVLARNGCEVIIPAAQVCCGSLHGHMGDVAQARSLFAQNARAFDPESVDAIIVTAAGCGSFMKEYPSLFSTAEGGERRAAEAFSAKVRDIHEFLASIPLHKPTKPLPLRVTYHDACHLAHAQKITEAPRALLKMIPELELMPLPESTWCCGSAGTYNVTHPEPAFRLLQRKTSHIIGTDAKIVASANPGCTIQLRYGLRERDVHIEVVHPITLLWQAYGLDEDG